MNDKAKKIIVTGGAGFIGSALIRYLIAETNSHVVNVDALTYAGNLENLKSVSDNERYFFIQADIRDKKSIGEIIDKFQPDCIMHLAAESHVDRSIDGPEDFIDTNIKGTFNLLESARAYWAGLEENRKMNFRFHHISTDEVFGSLGEHDLFHESSPYQPNSPYSASKAASDHLVRAWYETYGLPIIITNCSNNYGPYHYPEKLIPLVILNALDQKTLPIYGRGDQIRDWLYVDDHARALFLVVSKGAVGETYNIGGHNELENIEVVKCLCAILEELAPEYKTKVDQYADLITYVDDRPGHDQRYAIDANKIKNELGWEPLETFESGLRKTVQWYLANLDWCASVQDKYQRERLGVIKK